MKLKYAIILISVFVLFSACDRIPVPPVARVQPDTLKIHDSILIDDYAWLKDKTRSNPEILEYVSAENSFTKQEMLPYKKLQSKIYFEMINRLIEDDESVPIERNGYYSRMEKGRQYRVYCRRKGSLDAKEEIYLDVNILAQDFPFLSIYDQSISPDHRYLAFGIDTTGAEIYDLKIKDLTTGEYLSDSVNGVNEVVWANDNSTIFYTLQDDAGRSNRIFRHKLGTNTSEDELIFTDNDERFWVWVGKSRNQEYITLGSGSKTTSETWFLDADEPTGNFTLIESRKQGVRYYPLFHGNDLFIVSNENAPNKKVMKTTIARHNNKYWQEFISANDSIKIEADCFQNHLVITERSEGLKSKRILDLTTKKSHYIKFNEPIYSVYHWYSSEYSSSILRHQPFGMSDLDIQKTDKRNCTVLTDRNTAR